MSTFIDDWIAQGMPAKDLAVDAGHVILRQGERMGVLYVLENGQVEVVKNGSQICTVSEPGAVFGELSILLGCYQNATVRTLAPSKFKIMEQAEQFLDKNPKAAFQLARMLARRLSLLDAHFAELKSKVNAMQADAAGLAEGEARGRKFET
jgi:CRP/FNR family cyclic AMP-dependent transcriptional regulator